MSVRHFPIRTRQQSALLEVVNNPVAPDLQQQLANRMAGRNQANQGVLPAGQEPQNVIPANLAAQINPAIPVNQQGIPPVNNGPPLVPPVLPQPIQGNNQAHPPTWEAFLQALYGPRPTLPEYHGADHEPPQRFLEQCDEYLRLMQTPEGQRTKAIESGLKDEAEKWWSNFKHLDFDWLQFRDLLLRRFDGRQIRSELTAQLYSKKQGDKETASTFIQKKYRLFQRLRPEEDEQTKIETILGLMKPSLRRGIRPRNPEDFADFLNKAMEAERDEEEERPPNKPAKSEKAAPAQPAKAAETKEPRPIPKCWHCPEYHYHKDCPVLRQKQEAHQGNWRQPADKGNAGAGTPANNTTINNMEVDLLPHIFVEIGSKEISALVDPAASRNFVNPKILPTGLPFTAHEENVILADAGITMACKGTTTFDILIKGESYTIHAVVAPTLAHSLVLGYRWLRQEKGNLDLCDNCLRLGQTNRITVPLLNTQQPTPAPPIDMSQVQHGLEGDHLRRLTNILQENARIFYNEDKLLAQTQYAQHDIKLKEERPFSLPPYRYSDEKKTIIQTQVQEMLQQGIIEPSSSPYSSPVVIVKKKDGTSRFCVDYRRLNDLTSDSAQPLPVIHDSLRTLGQAKVFSTLDLKNGYRQIRLTPNSKEYTAFSTPTGGHYHFNVMPFGLKGAPGTFQRFISQEVLSNFIGEFCLVYLDDIIVYSNTLEEHLYHLQLVFEKLHAYQLTVHLKKCRFAQTELEYLGHTVSTQGNQANVIKLAEIVATPRPRNKKELRGFIGACSWLRDYIPRLSILLAPLTSLISNKCVFRWTDEHQEAFNAVKEAFQQPFPLTRPDPSRTMILQTDASSLGLGAVLYHEQSDLSRDIISFASRKLSPTESRYHGNEQECLAIIWAIKKFQPYLESRNFILRTDSRALTYLNQFKASNNKLWRWSILLQEYNFKIEHCPGKNNELPDLLSRNATEEEGEASADNFTVNEDILVCPEPTNQTVSTQPQLCNINSGNLYGELLVAQQEDEECKKIASSILEFQSLEQLSKKQEHFLLTHSLNDGYLWTRKNSDGVWQLRVPEELQQRVIHEYHESHQSGHPGIDETLRAIQERFWWRGLTQQVRRYIQACYLCACTKSTNVPHSTGLTPRKPTTPWETLGIDIMGPYPRTAKGHQYILVVTDLFSRWIEAFPMRSAETPKITSILQQEIFPRWGYPRHILSDNGPQFGSQKWQERLEQWQVEHWTTPIYHPRANPTERRNQEIKKGLRLHLHDQPHKNWDQYLPDILFQLRNRRNKATGQTPAHILMGRSLRRPGEWAAPTLSPEAAALDSRVHEAREHQRQYTQTYEQPSRSTTYQTGDLVYAKTHHLSNAAEKFNASLAAPWAGPFSVQQSLGGNTYSIQRGTSTVKVHASQLKPYHAPISQEAPKQVELPDPDVSEPPAKRYNLRERKQGSSPKN